MMACRHLMLMQHEHYLKSVLNTGLPMRMHRLHLPVQLQKLISIYGAVVCSRNANTGSVVPWLGWADEDHLQCQRHTSYFNSQKLLAHSNDEFLLLLITCRNMQHPVCKADCDHFPNNKA